MFSRLSSFFFYDLDGCKFVNDTTLKPIKAYFRELCMNIISIEEEPILYQV